MDGQDTFSFSNNQVGHTHIRHQQVGFHPSCPFEFRRATGGFFITTPNGIKMFFPPGRSSPLGFDFWGVSTWSVESGRGPVSAFGPNGITIDDNAPDNADVYRVRVCPSQSVFAQIGSNLGTAPRSLPISSLGGFNSFGTQRFTFEAEQSQAELDEADEDMGEPSDDKPNSEPLEENAEEIGEEQSNEAEVDDAAESNESEISNESEGEAEVDDAAEEADAEADLDSAMEEEVDNEAEVDSALSNARQTRRSRRQHVQVRVSA